MNRAVLLVLANLALAGCGKKNGDAATGKCYPPPREGRPLAIDGQTHVAMLSTADAGVAEVARLRAAAQDEHASIAAFARTIAELMALGAPLWLLDETQQALADEIRHTDRTLDELEALTGERPRFGALTQATAPLARPAEAFFRDVLVGGAIGETLAAAAAQARLADRPNDLDAMLVVDESRHAALAFKTLRWLLAKRPDLRGIVDEERARLEPATERLLAPLFATAFEA